MKSLLVLLALLLSGAIYSQNTVSATTIQPEEDYENIHVKKIGSNEHTTSFIIWVKKGVKAHKHEKHAESLYVIEGTGEMTVGDETFDIKPGDYFIISENTFHSLVVTSELPIKVLSIQAPEFYGKDRIFKEDK